MRGVWASAAAVLAALGVAGPSAAHGDAAAFTVIEAAPAALSVHYVVELRYADDGHPVSEADVVLTGTGPDGGAVGPVALTGGAGGRYEATVAFPGRGVWGVRIASEAPAAVVEQTSTVGVATTVAEPTTTVEQESSTTTTAEPGEGGGGVRPGTVIAVGIAAVAIAFVLRRQRERQRAGL